MINVITINLNNKDGLKKTIESVVNQTYFDKINYIIIDGGSTDGSVDVIKEYQDKLYYWVSEKDNGIFNAMNKGIDAAPNEGYCLFLNSGDFLVNSLKIERIWNELNVDILYGNEIMIKSDGRQFTSTYPDILDERFFKISALPHQSTFIKTELLKKHKYSEVYFVMGDWKLLRELIMEEKVSYKHIKKNISIYNLDGISTLYKDIFKDEKRNYYRSKNICL